MVGLPVIHDMARRLFSRDLYEMYSVVPVSYDERTGVMAVVCRKGKRFEELAEIEVENIEVAFAVSGHTSVSVVLHPSKRKSKAEMDAMADKYWPEER